MGGVILAFSQLIAYSWLKIPAEIGIMDALNSGKLSRFRPLLTEICLAVAVLRRRVVWLCYSDVCRFCGKLLSAANWRSRLRFIGGLMSTQPSATPEADPSTMQWATSSPVP